MNAYNPNYRPPTNIILTAQMVRDRLFFKGPMRLLELREAMGPQVHLDHLVFVLRRAIDADLIDVSPNGIYSSLAALEQQSA